MPIAIAHPERDGQNHRRDRIFLHARTLPAV
jgi:hypothetical protein